MLRYRVSGVGWPSDGKKRDGSACGRVTRREGLVAGFRYCPAHREQAEADEEKALAHYARRLDEEEEREREKRWRAEDARRGVSP